MWFTIRKSSVYVLNRNKQIRPQLLWINFLGKQAKKKGASTSPRGLASSSAYLELFRAVGGKLISSSDCQRSCYWNVAAPSIVISCPPDLSHLPPVTACCYHHIRAPFLPSLAEWLVPSTVFFFLQTNESNLLFDNTELACPGVCGEKKTIFANVAATRYWCYSLLKNKFWDVFIYRTKRTMTYLEGEPNMTLTGSVYIRISNATTLPHSSSLSNAPPSQSRKNLKLISELGMNRKKKLHFLALRILLAIFFSNLNIFWEVWLIYSSHQKMQLFKSENIQPPLLNFKAFLLLLFSII